MLVAALIGILGAIGSIVFRYAITLAGIAFAAFGAAVTPWPPLAPPLVLAAGAIVLLGLERLFPGHALGYGFPRFLEMIHLEGGRVKKRWMIVKTLGSAVSLGAGASVGREGPIAQIGGSIGSAVAQLLRTSTDRTKLFVACGAAAGIATVFNAPIASVMFAQEIILVGEIELANFSLLVISTAAAVITSHAALGAENVFIVPRFQLASYWELLTYGAMGLILGAVAAGYTRLFHFSLARAASLRFSTATKLIGGLVVVGCVGIALPQNLSDGYPVINQALAGELPWRLMATLAIAKMGTSCVSLAAGAPGGVFGPIFFIGAMSGGAFRALSTVFLPGLTGPRGSYALVGLTTFLGACTHAPLTAIFLLFEMTGSYDIALPALVTTILGVIVASNIEPESIDTLSLARAGKSLRPPREQIMDVIPVASALHRDVESIAADAPVSEVLRIVSESRATTFPVVDAQGRLVGAVSLHHVRPLLVDPTGHDVKVAADLCDPHVPTVTPETNLGQALGRMEADDVEEIPVVDAAEPTRVVGLLSRADAIRAYNRALIAMRTVPSTAGADQLPQWSKAYRVTTVPVPTHWQGQSLRELDWRARFGVSVVAVQPHDQPHRTFEVPDPDRTLETGDSLVIAGEPAKVRRFERAARSRAGAVFSASERAGG